VVGGELAQRVVERGDGACSARVRVADIERRLGGDHDMVARNHLQRLAEHRFGIVGGGGVEEIDPEIERLMYQSDGLGFALASAEPEPAEPTAPQSGDARTKAGSTKRYVFHVTARSRNAMIV